MKEGADHQFLIAPVPVGHGRRLQTMAVVVHLVPETLDMLLGPQKAQGLLRLVFAVKSFFCRESRVQSSAVKSSIVGFASST